MGIEHSVQEHLIRCHETMEVVSALLIEVAYRVLQNLGAALIAIREICKSVASPAQWVLEQHSSVNVVPAAPALILSKRVKEIEITVQNDCLRNNLRSVLQFMLSVYCVS